VGGEGLLGEVPVLFLLVLCLEELPEGVQVAVVEVVVCGSKGPASWAADLQAAASAASSLATETGLWWSSSQSKSED